MRSVADYLLVISSALLLVLYVALFVRAAAHRGPFDWVASLAAWRSRNGAQTKVRAQERSAIKAMSNKLMNQRRLEWMQMASPICLAVLAIVVTLSLFNTISGRVQVRNGRQDVVTTVAFGAQMVAQQRLSASSTRRQATATFVYVLLMATSTLFVVLAEEKRFLIICFEAMALTPRFVLSIAYMRRGVVTSFSAFHCAAACFAFWNAEESCEHDLTVDFTGFVLGEVMLSLAVVLVAAGTEWSVAKQTGQQIEAMVTQGETTATRRLLNTICDATFELDADLRIVDDAAQLASTLQYGCNRSLRGAQADLLVFAEDRELFRERVSTPVPASQSAANVWHVRMRDGLGNLLRMEMFHVPVLESLTGMCHLIGVREHADAGEYIKGQELSENVSAKSPRGWSQPLPGGAMAGAAGCGHAEPRSPWPGTPALRNQEPSSSSSETSGVPCSEHRSARTLAASDHSGPEQLRVRFDPVSFTVLESSGSHSEPFQRGACLKRLLSTDHDFAADLGGAVISIRRALPSEPHATLQLFSSVAFACDGAPVVGMCRVVLSAADLPEAALLDDPSQPRPLVATLQLLKIAKSHPRQPWHPTARMPSLSTPGSAQAESLERNDSECGSSAFHMDNSAYLRLMMQGLPGVEEAP